MANDTDPLLSSDQVSTIYNAINTDVPRNFNPEDIEGHSRNTQDDISEEDEPIPARNLHLIIPSLFIGMTCEPLLVVLKALLLPSQN